MSGGEAQTLQQVMEGFYEPLKPLAILEEPRLQQKAKAEKHQSEVCGPPWWSSVGAGEKDSHCFTLQGLGPS